MQLRERRRTRAADSDVPSCLTPPTFFSRKAAQQRAALRMLVAPRAEGVEARGAFLDEWLNCKQRAELVAAGFGAGLTLVDLAGHWTPLTLATRSELLPAEYGWFAPRNCRWCD